MIDQLFMKAVQEEDARAKDAREESDFIVATGVWKMDQDGSGNVYIRYTDDFSDKSTDVYLLEGCQTVEGERLVMFTNILHNGRSKGLVLFKSMVYEGDKE